MTRTHSDVKAKKRSAEKRVSEGERLREEFLSRRTVEPFPPNRVPRLLHPSVYLKKSQYR
jgi:hypothetical protein